MKVEKDKIELLLPLKAEFVSVARLTASGIANRIGFDIETIEDIKVAVAEVCNKLVRMRSECTLHYKIIFEIFADRLNITFSSGDSELKNAFNNNDDEFGISIITALMDNVWFCKESDCILSMSKVTEGNS
jgi:serine/threonine-protein kinase RsbW